MVLRKRKPLRLADYDYSTPGAYFVTICTQGRICLFEPVPIRAMIQKWWNELPHKFPDVETDEFVVMLNHTHGILIITHPHDVRADLRVGPGSDIDGNGAGGPTASGGHVGTGGHAGPPLPLDAVRADLRVGPPADLRVGPGHAADGHVGPSLPEIVQWFKTMTTNEYIRGVKQLGWPPFPGKLWQRSYYEHIIRDDREYNAIRHYIRENPANWHRDRNNMKDPGL